MFCTACGTEINDTSNFCHNCGQRPGFKGQSVVDLEQQLGAILPVGVPFSAIAAGYLGLFSVLIFPAPFAVVFGIIGLVQLRRPPKRRGAFRCWTGIVLGGLGSAILLFAVITAMLP